MGRFDLTLTQILAQATELPTNTDGNGWGGVITGLEVILVLAALFILPFLFGSWWAKRLKMPDHGWRIGLIIFTLAAAGLILAFGGKPRLGIDLAGGVVFVAEVKPGTTIGVTDEEAAAAESGSPELSTKQMDALVAALAKRLNPGGVKEITIRPYGRGQVEIIIPEATEAEAEEYWRLASTAGFLQFRIVANAEVNRSVYELAQEQPFEDIVKGSDGKERAHWVLIGTEDIQGEASRPIQLPDHSIVRREGMLPYHYRSGTPPPNGKAPEQVLVLNDEQQVDGTHIEGASTQIGNDGGWQVAFRMNSSGAKLMRWLTSENLKEPRRALGIILDGELLSAPAIQGVIADQGQITGNFSQKEVDFIVGVLNAGKLPAALRSEPISQNNISPTLGEDLIRKGIIAILVSLVVILIFMAFYYRFSGIVACFALLVNILLIVAGMIAIGGTFTLPGLAGLVLTVGMSVDANVLIFERIREEMSRGSGLRMALRNGFAKATTTIVDANVTTLITALVLYVIGTDQVKGFAVTLILGILASMFTAIFCAKVIFDIAERKRWISQLRMMHIVGNTHIDFMGKEKIAGVISIIAILAGITGVIIRNEKMLAIDFMGGTSVQFLLKEDKPLKIEEVRSKINDWKRENTDISDVTVVSIEAEQFGRDRVYQVDVDLDNVRDLQAGLQKTFAEELQVHELKFTPAAAISHPAPATEEAQPSVQPPATDSTPAAETTPTEDATSGETAPSEPAESETPAATQPAPAESETAPAETPATEGEATPPATEEPAPATGDGASLRNQPRYHYVAFLQEEEPETTPPAEAATETPAEEAPDTAPAEGETATEGEAETTPPAEQPASEETPAEEPATEEPAAGETSPTADSPAEEQPGADEIIQFGDEDRGSVYQGPTQPQDELQNADYESESFLSFDEPTTGQVLTRYVTESLEANALEGVQFQLAYISMEEPTETADDETAVAEGEYAVWDGRKTLIAKEWRVSFSLSPEEANPVLATMQTTINNSPIWLQSNEIGSTVAGKTQEMAIAALLASLVGIVGYIWIRFQKVVYGLAAVVALVHDVVIVLGIVAFTYWLEPVFGFLQVEEFRINLPMVAAFLTLIGYSLNDTIVVFDRIREVKGKSPYLTKDIINTSINQTLSRTLLTSGTTLMTVGILYFLGGEGIHGFAFALLVGIIVGTYSSIYIASPVLLWMSNYDKKHATASKEPEKVLG